MGSSVGVVGAINKGIWLGLKTNQGKVKALGGFKITLVAIFQGVKLQIFFDILKFYF